MSKLNSSLKKKFYRLQKTYAKDEIRCPSCAEKLKMNQLIAHAKTKHDVDPKVMCTYCLGLYKWPRGQKLSKENLCHLLECLKRCWKKFVILPATVQNTKNVVSNCLTCRNFKPVPCDLCGRKRDRKSEYIRLYDAILEKFIMWQTGIKLFNEASGFHDDLFGIVKRFLQNDLKWYHIMVRASAFDTFVKEMEKIKDEIVLLPYWCLCDGLTNSRIVHRHMILACELESSFEHVWKYKIRNEIKDNGRCKDSVRIKDVFHLVNCIQYVSQKNASCDGVKIRDSVNENKFRESHFYINRPLPKHGIAILCMLFDGGIEKLMSQVNLNKNVVDWMDDAIQVYDNKRKKWGVALKKTGFKYLNCTIPVCRELEPTDGETDLYLTWMNEQKIYFKENLKLLELSKDEWCRHQFEKGNTFQSIGDEIYVYGKKQQNVMHQLKIREDILNNRFEMKNTILEAKKQKYRKERNIFQRENTSLKTEMANMRRSFHMTLSEIQKDIEIEKLKLEIESLKMELRKNQNSV